MGTLSRVRHLVSANANALLERVENPTKMLKALIREMEDGVEEARRAARDLLLEQKQLQRQLEQSRDNELVWHERAEKALTQGREDLARDALARKQAIATRALELSRALTLARESTARIDTDIVRLESRLGQARARQRQWQKEPPHRHGGSVADRTLDSVAARFERLETNMDLLESRVDAYDLGRSPAPLSLAAEAQVEAELADLKARLVGVAGGDESHVGA